MRDKRQVKRLGIILSVALLILLVLSLPMAASAAEITLDLAPDPETQTLGSLELLFMFTILALAPSILIMMTSFTRIVIVLSLLRNAVGLQQTPPSQVIIGLSLFLSLFIMQPVLVEINETAIEPYSDGLIGQEQALEAIGDPLKEFMLKHINESDLSLFLSLSGEGETVEEKSQDELMELGLHIIVPSFLTSELSRAFTMGFLLFIPFLVIDMIVASTLMSMGMVMLPPSMISLPFKLMLFVVVDGWRLIMETLISGFF